MTCKACSKPLRSNNTVGYCGQHRRLSPEVRQSQITASRRWQTKNATRFAAYNRQHKLKSNYGLTPSDYARLWHEQLGCCANCEVWSGESKLCVDHDHETGKVRGLLCHSCNILLGKAADSARLLSSAITYLEKN